MMWWRLRLFAVAGLAACASDGTGAGEVLVVSEVVITPPGAGLVVGGTQQLTASPRTSSGIPVPGRTVTWYTSDEGIATVSASGLVTAVALGEATITARVDQITAGVLVNVSPKPVASVTVDPPAAALQVGQTVTIQATALDGEGEPLAGRTITFLSDNATIASVSTAGVVTAIAPGQTQVRARAEGKEGTSTITVTARPATRLAFTTQPANAAAGQPLAPVRVTVQDEIGGTVTTATNNVTLELADNPDNVTLGGTLTVAAVAGVATFNDLSLTRAGTGYTLRATAGSLSPALSSPFAITSGPGAALGMAVQPSGSAQSGLPLAQAPAVQIRDAHGNPVSQPGVTVSVGLAGSSGTLTGPVTATTGSSGAATFPGLVIAGGPGTYQLRFTAPNLTAVVSEGIVLASSTLAMVTQPSASAINSAALAQQPVVRITELDGTPLPQAGVPVTVTLTGNGATLSGTTTVNTNGSGVASFTGLTITGTAGSFALSFAAPGIAPITSSPITLGAGAATQIRIAVQPPAGAGSGVALSPAPEIQLADQSGNPVSTAGIQVTASIASGTGGTLGGTQAVPTNAGGRAIFSNLSIAGASGSFTLRFSTAALGSVVSNAVTLGAGNADHLSITTQPSSSGASGVALSTQPAVQLRDGANNPVSLAGVTITASIASGGGTLVGSATAVTNGSGLATFIGLGISGSVGNRTLQFTAAGLTPVISSSISITPGPAARLVLTAQPSPTAASGVAFAQQPVVQVQDGAGNPVAQAGTAITAAIESGSGATLGGGLIALTNGSGQASYTNLMLTGASGSFTLRFSSGTLTAAVSNTVTLGAGAGSKLAITNQPPPSIKNGTAFGVTIQLQDAANNPVTQAGVQVVATLLSGDPALGGTTSVATNASGQAVFSNLVLTGAVGARTIIFAASGYASATSSSITLTAGDPAGLEITTQPSSFAQSGVPLDPQPVIHLEDQSGNAVSQSGVLVTASLASGSGTLVGETATTNGSGVATFSDLTITGSVGAKTLRFSATGLSATTSGTITLQAGGAFQIAAHSAQTQSAPVNTAVSVPPSVIVRDEFGNPVSNVAVTFTVTAGGGSISPASPAVVSTNASGVATLISWTLGTQAGSNNNTVTAAAAGLSGSPVSFTASATAGAAATIEANSDQSQSAPISSAVDEAPSVLVTDAEGNPVSGVQVTFTVTAGGGSTSPASPAMVNTNGSGIASLASWTLGPNIGTDNNTVTATAAGLSGSPVTFTASGTIGAAANIEAASDVSQTAEVGTAVVEAPAVLVTDGGGNPVSGVNVTFTVSGGSIDPTPAVIATGADGIASLTSWTLGTTAGSNSVTASAAGLGDVLFQATGTPGAAASLTITQQPSGTATTDVVLAQQPIVQVKDAHGNPKPGVTVSVSLDGDGTLEGAGTAISDAGGLAAFSGLKIVGGTTGTKTLTFSAGGVPDATSDPIDYTGTDASLTLVSGTDATSVYASVGPAWAGVQTVFQAQVQADFVTAVLSDSVAAFDISARHFAAKAASWKHLTEAVQAP